MLSTFYKPSDATNRIARIFFNDIMQKRLLLVLTNIEKIEKFVNRVSNFKQFLSNLSQFAKAMVF